ncbi:hypothetical protein GCM10022393_35390 [Aquimarina addita]|uniref:DUF4190 domain-containing protein n=1 Tax=Aquimarina addita TaxID=870485 RepID=A0ABP6UR93_9FLAO
MEDKQQIPNATLVLIFGIVSIITALCCYGFIGLIFGIIGLVISNKSVKLYKNNPDLYYGYENLNAGRICAIIGIVLGAIYFLFVLIYFIAMGAMLPWAEMMNGSSTY